MNQFLQSLGKRLATFLNEPVAYYETLDLISDDVMLAAIRPGDVLLVEGNTRIARVIRYVTQSNWSHAALYIGDALGGDEPHMLIEADIVEGIITVPLSTYRHLNTRICRPVGIGDEDRQKLIDYTISQIGHAYDLKNVFDLLRFYMPMPMPARYRRRMLAFGSGEPTQAICSTLIAKAFQMVRYPILPRRIENCTEEECLLQRHYSHFTPRDFDHSPYFAIVKPTLERGFNYRSIGWAKEPSEV
jgi:hypothetical protein